MTDYADLVKRLRKAYAEITFPGGVLVPHEWKDAADAIETLVKELDEANRVLAYTDFGECWTCKKALKFKDAYRCFDCDFVFCKACCQPHITEMSDKIKAAERERDEARAERDAYEKKHQIWNETISRRAEAAEAEVERLKAALWRLIEYTTDERCSLDHHGHCQAHGYMDTGCPVGVARAALEAK